MKTVGTALDAGLLTATVSWVDKVASKLLLLCAEMVIFRPGQLLDCNPSETQPPSLSQHSPPKLLPASCLSESGSPNERLLS